MDSTAIQIAPSRRFDATKLDKAKLALEFPRLLGAPGTVLNGLDLGKIQDHRVPSSAAIKPEGVVGDGYKGLASVANVPNPSRPDGQWNPFDHLPEFVFDPREDAFPVDPSFDGDGNIANNGPDKPGDGPGHYVDGLIGGKQPLTSAFSVTKKGDFYVATTHLYMATNKAGDYHNDDWAVAQIYLKPNAQGKLEPTHLFTSWHHGGRLTKWEDLALTPQGRPIVRVELGSHALAPLGPGQRAPEGLRLRGDGSVSMGGKLLLGQKLKVDALQSNVSHARLLLPGTEAYATRTQVMRWGEIAYNPLLPQDFEGRGLFWQIATTYGAKLKAKAASVLSAGRKLLGKLNPF